jgi:hypothetical protein
MFNNTDRPVGSSRGDVSFHWFKTPRFTIKMAQFSQHLGDASCTSWNTKAQLQQQYDDMMQDNSSLNYHDETISAFAKG